MSFIWEQLKNMWSRVHPQYWRTRLRQYKVLQDVKRESSLVWSNTWEILIAGSRSQHGWRVRALEPPRASTQWVWLWGWHLPVLTLPQSDRLRRDDPRGGHAGNLQARTLHLRRMGVWWPSLLAASRTPHVLPQVNWKATFPWCQVSSSYERYEERAKIILQQLVAQVKHLQFYTEVFGV